MAQFRSELNNHFCERPQDRLCQRIRELLACNSFSSIASNCTNNISFKIFIFEALKTSSMPSRTMHAVACMINQCPPNGPKPQPSGPTAGQPNTPSLPPPPQKPEMHCSTYSILQAQ